MTTGAGGSAKSIEITAVVGSPAADTLGLADSIGVQATGIGGTEAAQVTVSEGFTADFEFDFNGSVTQLRTGDDRALVDRDNLSFDISYNDGSSTTNATITVDEDSSPRGAAFLVSLLNGNDGGGNLSGSEATGISNAGAMFVLLSNITAYLPVR